MNMDLRISKNNNFENKMLLLNFLLVVSIQTTDLAIFSVKLGEIYFILFTVYFFISKSRVEKVAIYLALFFSVIALIAFIININTEFYLPTSEHSILKQPFFISITRLVEIISCIGLVIYIVEIEKKYTARNKEFKNFLDTFFYLNAMFAVFHIISYLLHINGLIDSVTVYGEENRLRGFFVEGGPFGLFYAFLFSIGYFLKINKKILLIYLIIIILAQSKAGISFILFIFLFNFLYFKIKSLYLKFIGMILILAISFAGIIYIGDNYVQDIKNIEIMLQSRSDDTNLIQGRIAATFIGSEMIKVNPLFGIGFGNYPLVRNDPIYLGIFPPVAGWDLTGLGIFTMIVESGIVGFIVFSLLIFSMLRKVTYIGKTLILIFYFTLFFGVQIYFLYPWVALAIALLHKKRKVKYDIDNRFQNA